MPRSIRWFKGEDLSTYIQADWKSDPESAAFKNMQIYTVLWNCKYNLYWPPDPGDLNMSLGNNCKSQGCGYVYKLFSEGDSSSWSKAEEVSRWHSYATFLESNSIGH